MSNSLFCILGWPGLWSLGSRVTARFIQSLRLGVIHLWHPQKHDQFFCPHPYCLQKGTIDQLFKNNRICKLVKIQEPPTHLLCGHHKCMFPYSDNSFPICFMTNNFCLYFLKLIANWHRLKSQASHTWNLSYQIY